MKFKPSLLGIFLLLLSSLSVWANPSPGRFEGWQNRTRAWSTGLLGADSNYSEGQVVPLRYVVSYPAGSVHTLRLRYDYGSATLRHFFDSFGTFNATEASALLLNGVSLPSGQETPGTWPFPADPALPVLHPGMLTSPGLLTAYNVSSLSFISGYTSAGAVREITVKFTVAGTTGSGNRTVVFGYGARLASELYWGVGGGALGYTGTNRRAYIVPDKTTGLTVTLRPSVLSQNADLNVTMAGPTAGCVGSEVTYEVTLKNPGPNGASTVVLTDTLPAGTTLVSAIATAGTVSGTGPVNVTLPSLAAGSQVGLTVKLKINSAGTGSVKNQASVTSTTPDSVASNNSASATTSTVDGEPPVITVPEDYELQLAADQCEATADFTATPATAVDNCGGPVTITYDPPPGSLLGPGDHKIVVTAADASGNQSQKSFTVRVRDSENVSWLAALPLTLVPDPASLGVLRSSFTQCINYFDQSRWYRFTVKPGERVIALLTGLPENYDLVMFSDILQAYQELTSNAGDLPALNAQFASDAFSPAVFSADVFSPVVFSPAAFSPSVFSPSVFSPSVFSPTVFSPSVFSPSVFSPDAFAPSVFSPSVFSPSVFSPSVFSPSVFSPSVFSPSVFSPSVFSPAVFSDAQVRSVIGISGFNGTANEGIMANTWNSSGDFYLRVRGRNGVFQPGAPYQLSVFVVTGACENVQLVPPSDVATGPAATAGSYKTLILTDTGRLVDDGQKAALSLKLADLAARTEVKGKIIDLAQYPRVQWYNQQADANFDCPFAKNLVAASIRDIISDWRGLNPIENIVLAGSDAVIPFFRYPDEAMLGPESNYIPPVNKQTPSQASLRLNYVLGQDAYGAECELQLKLATLPLPQVPVGRLVENPSDMIGLIQAYLDTPAGVVPTPTSALVTGYDFLTDAAEAVQAELEAGMGVAANTLIAPANLAPIDSWTADQLREALFGKRHDIVFLAGHFSAFSALAADYLTFILSAEFNSTTTDFKNTILFSAGCHSGYNVVDADGIPFVTPQADWAQAAARRKATLIAGTGYQYGDTDFLEYSERIYQRFAHEFRAGSGPVSVGQALLRAKRQYLATTPVMRGIHHKAFLEVALYGLPMLSVNMPSGRVPVDPGTSEVGTLNPVATDPGKYLELKTADLHVTPTLTEHTVTLQNVEAGGTVEAKYYEGSAGTLVNPAEPVLPLESLNVSVDNITLRGVGWRGGKYVDEPHVIPLTGAATTEIRGVHASFLTEVFYPIQFWSVNYFDTLCGATGNSTRLYVYPAQFLSDNAVAPEGTLRRHTELDFRLFYSANTKAYDLDDGSGTITPAVSGPPSISAVFTTSELNKVRFQAYVTGNPAAGIQEVWVTYSAAQGSLYGTWQSFNLVQSEADSTLWTGELDLTGTGAAPSDVRFVVQAVNGVGLTTLNTRRGAYHVPDLKDGWESNEDIGTQVQLMSPATEGPYGSKVTVQASWSSGSGIDVAGRSVVFTLGDQQVVGVTDASGIAKATINLRSAPGLYELKATFSGGFGLGSSLDTAPFTIRRAATHLELDPSGATINVGGPNGVSALLSDDNGPMIERSVLFIATGPTTIVRTAITDNSGRARFGSVPTGTYTITAYFGESVLLPDGVSTVDLSDDRYLGSEATTNMTVDSDAPTLISISLNKTLLTPVNRAMVAIAVSVSFSDPSGTTTSRISKITSNEPDSGTGIGDLPNDIEITGLLTAKVRAEASPTGTGRIYTVFVETTDAYGNRRVDQLRVRVPRPI